MTCAYQMCYNVRRVDGNKVHRKLSEKMKVEEFKEAIEKKLAEEIGSEKAKSRISAMKDYDSLIKEEFADQEGRIKKYGGGWEDAIHRVANDIAYWY